MRQRLYVDGKLTKSVEGDAAKLRRWLDNAERGWLEHGLNPLTAPGEFDSNLAHEVTRVSPDELLITSTSGSKLRFVNVER